MMNFLAPFSFALPFILLLLIFSIIKSMSYVRTRPKIETAISRIWKILNSLADTAVFFSVFLWLRGLYGNEAAMHIMVAFLLIHLWSLYQKRKTGSVIVQAK